ncbi:low-density lipoprotein receptor class A domain-containing protein 2 [Microcaecilia unicolor]|uniref:Low-density lipoprotein receptor class A domain-containing protein 2 n=1 Tax=Microcaecilia unicolor TaxID=1415580 RepID=A0A6P7ZVF1_9AMPH|nr:low-density lipoprotein receptor class A domain-containing protein 2 [Microcaecilia unicolor]
MVKGKGMHLELSATLVILLSCWTQTIHSIDTVNLVDFCGQTIKGNGMIVNSHKESRKYYFVTIGTDCQLTMQASSPKDKIQFQFRFFLVYSLLRMSTTTTREPPENIRSGARSADPCHAGSYVQFYDGKGRNARPLGSPLCGRSIPRPVLSTGNYLTLQLVTRGQQPRVDFVGDFTSFRLGTNQMLCSPYFHCQNGKCIPISLVCDNKGIDNCGDGTDQSTQPPAQCKGTLPTEVPATTVPIAAANSTTQGMQLINMSCGSAETNYPHSPDSILQQGSLTDKRTYFSFLVLYIVLGLIVGVALLFWCCWSPGWFIWRVLTKPPFEPLSSCILKDLTLKALLLMAIASARRVSELQALSCRSPFLEFSSDRVVLRPVLSFLPKALTHFHSSQLVVLPVLGSFSRSEEQRLLKLLDVKRVLKHYVKSMEDICRSDRRFTQRAYGF